MVTVTVCVGSSCHIKGARDVIRIFNALVKEYHLDEYVELKGSFCMERCGKGINWQINDQDITSRDSEEAEQTFMEKIIYPHTADTKGMEKA